MSRRTVVRVLGLALVLALAGSAVASAEFRGTDLWGNIMPADGSGGLVNRYPLSAYMLDVHVGSALSVGGFDSDNATAAIAQFLAKWIFFIGVVFIRVVISIFQWAFNVNLVTGGGGALGSASVLSHHYYVDFVQPFMITFVLLFGGWLLWKTLKSHERSEAGSAVVRVVLLAVLSLAIITHPQDTLGRAYGMVDDVSTALVSRGGDSHSVSDSIWRTFVYRPYVVLQFGGLEHCVNPQVKSADGFPLASGPGRTLCRDSIRRDARGFGGYAPLFLQGTDAERKMLYESINKGELVDSCTDPICRLTNPAAPSPPAGWHVDKADAPAVDMMQAGGATQRLVFAIGFFACMIFGALLIALVAVASLFAQVALVALSVVVSFTVLAALFPPLHRHYMHFLSLLGKVLIGKAVYALLLAVLLSTSAAMMTVAGQGGYAIALAVQALIFGGAFIKRKAIIARATGSRAATRYTDHEDHAKAAVAGTAAASLGAISGGASTFAQTMREGWSMRRDEHASDPASTPDSSSPPASAGRQYSPPGDPVSLPATSNFEQPRRQDAVDQTAERPQEETVPTRSFQEDLDTHRRGDQARSGDLNGSPHSSGVHYGAVSASSLRDDIRDERELREVSGDHSPYGDPRPPIKPAPHREQREPELER